MKFLEIADDAIVKLAATGDMPEAVHQFEARQIRAVNAALAARRPLLVRGEPGMVCGKCRISDDHIEEKRFPLFLAKDVLRELIDSDTRKQPLLAGSCVKETCRLITRLFQHEGDVTMASRLIRLIDGTLVEVEVNEDEAQPISNKTAAKVNAAIDGISETLLKAVQPITSVWKELNKDLLIDQAEIELGLGFEAEGNLYITKAKGNANLVVRLRLKPNPDTNSPLDKAGG